MPQHLVKKHQQRCNILRDVTAYSDKVLSLEVMVGSLQPHQSGVCACNIWRGTPAIQQPRPAVTRRQSASRVHQRHAADVNY